MASDETKTVNGLRLMVYGTASVKEIVPKSGENQGKKLSLLTFRAFHPENPASKQSDDSSANNSKWYSVESFNERALVLDKVLQDGMVLYVSGRLKEQSYTAKDGTVKQGLTIVAYQIGLDLLQNGLKQVQVTFTRPAKKGATQ